MSSKTLLIRCSGLAAAVAAHALFAGTLLAAQPRPEQYLARLAPPAARPAPELQLAGHAARPARGTELPAARVLRPVSLVRGLVEC